MSPYWVRVGPRPVPGVLIKGGRVGRGNTEGSRRQRLEWCRSRQETPRIANWPPGPKNEAWDTFSITASGEASPAHTLLCLLASEKNFLLFSDLRVMVLSDSSPGIQYRILLGLTISRHQCGSPPRLWGGTCCGLSLSSAPRLLHLPVRRRRNGSVASQLLSRISLYHERIFHDQHSKLVFLWDTRWGPSGDISTV